jgi:hypothetical protein
VLLWALDKERSIILLLHVNHRVDEELYKLSVLDVFGCPSRLVKFEVNIEDPFKPESRFEIRTN